MNWQLKEVIGLGDFTYIAMVCFAPFRHPIQELIWLVNYQIWSLRIKPIL